jgi:hypothetical protein
MPFHYFGLQKPANNDCMTPLLCFVAFSGTFGFAPNEAEIQEGKRIYGRKKGIDRTELDARVVIGKWFNGESTQTVEEAIFITPGFLSRWLGYQQAAGTPSEETQSAWIKCSGQFSNKSIVVIRLARLCTVDFIDGDIDNSAKPDCLDNVTFQIRQAAKPWIPVKYRTVQDIQQRRPEEVLKERWDEILAKFTAWPSKPTENDLIPDIRWGLNRRVTYIAETPAIEANSLCELKIVEKDRTRTIAFRYPKS